MTERKRNCCIDCIAFCITDIDGNQYGWCTIFGHDTALIGGCSLLKKRNSEDIAVYPFEYVPIKPMNQRDFRKWYKNPYLKILSEPRTVKPKDKAGISITSKVEKLCL